jgi:nucleotide-binding universal stress UspA family protein
MDAGGPPHQGDVLSRSIVVGWDGSTESTAALDWALKHAAPHRTPVCVVGARELSAREAQRASLAQQLLAVREVQSLAHPDLSVTTLLVDDVPVEALVRQSRDALMLVLGSRGAGGMQSLIAGSTTLGVAARAACPVIAIPGPPATAGCQIVVGTDGSAVSESALAFAFEQAEDQRLPLTVLHAWRDPMSTSLLGATVPVVRDRAGHTRRQQDVLVDLLEPWRQKFPDVMVTAHVVHGTAVNTLVDRSHNATLLVVGCRGRGAVQRAVLGSVSQGVMHLADVPVAVVPRNS